MAEPRITDDQPLPVKGFSRNVLLLAGGAALAQVVGVLSSPVLTRVYTPEDFGNFAVYSSLLSILSVVGSWRYELALPLAEDDDAQANLLGLSILILAGMSLLTMMLASAFWEWVVAWIHAPRVGPYLWALGLSLLGAGGYQVLNYWAIRKKAFGQVGRTKFSLSVTQVITQCGLGVLHTGVAGLVTGDLLGDVAASVTLVASVVRDGAFPRRVTRKGMVRAAQRFMKFPLITSWASLLNVASLQMPLFLITGYFGAASAGLYSLAYRLLGLPISMVGQAVGQVFFSDAAQLRNNPAVLARLTERLAVALFGLGLPLFGAVGIAGGKLFPALFGPSWAPGGVYAQVLSPWFLFWLVSSPLSTLLIVREWQGSSLLFTILEFTSRVIAIVVGARLGSPVWALALLTVSGILISVISIHRFLRAGYSSLLTVAAGWGRVVVVASPWLLLMFLAVRYTSPLICVVTVGLCVLASFGSIVRMVPEVGALTKRFGS